MEFDPSKPCPFCLHPPNCHKKRSGACMATKNCLCGWEIVNGIWYEVKNWIRHGREKKPVKGKSRHVREILKGPCYFCGKPATTVDHMLARRFGGTNEWSNTVGACKRCNNLKGSMSYEEFVALTEQLMWWEFDEDKRRAQEGVRYAAPRSDQVMFVSASREWTPARIRRVLHRGLQVRAQSTGFRSDPEAIRLRRNLARALHRPGTARTKKADDSGGASGSRSRAEGA